MVFEAGEVVQESGLPGVKYDFNYGARVTVPQENTGSSSSIAVPA